MTDTGKRRWLRVLPSLFTATLVLCLIASGLPIGMTSANEAVPPIQATRPSRCDAPVSQPRHYRVAASPETIHWGYYSKNRQPVIAVQSQDYVTLETITPACLTEVGESLKSRDARGNGEVT